VSGNDGKLLTTKEMMTPRERVIAILNRNKPDQVPWFGDLDYWATGLMARRQRPNDFKESDDYIDWHRDLRVGFYLQGYFPFKTFYENCEVKSWHQGNRRYTQIDTPKGSVRECWQWIEESCCEAPIERFLKTENDLAAMRYIYENVHYEPDYDLAYRRWQQVADMGIVLCYLPKSPFMHLVALESGIENLAYIIHSAEDKFSELIEAMTFAHDQAAQIALDSPAEALMIPENLSSEVVGPKYFEKYVRSYQQKWAEKMRQAGKYSFVHMDGTLRGLLRQECSIGLFVLEALTPAPVGDLAIEQWADFAEDSTTVFWGGIPGVYFTSLISDAEFDRHVRHVLSVMRRQPRYVLGVADQVPPNGLERRVRRVADLVDLYGRYE